MYRPILITGASIAKHPADEAIQPEGASESKKVASLHTSWVASITKRARDDMVYMSDWEQDGSSGLT